MALKKSSYTRQSRLASDNVERITSPSLSKEERAANAGSVLLLAKLLDSIATEEVTHVTIGKPRSGDCFLLTVNTPDGQKQFVGFADVFEFGTVALAEMYD